MIPAEVFDADLCAKELLSHDRGVWTEVRQHLGDDVFTREGEPDRVKIRETVFADPDKRTAIESILHPRIRSLWKTRADAAKTGRDWLIVDIPLLFETHAEDCFDTIVVVACSAANQLRRLVQTRKLDAAIALKMIASQLDLKVKMQKAPHVIWNDGSLMCLDAQAVLAADCLKKRHG